MQLLKVLVIGMAGLIAIGIAVLAWGLSSHWGRLAGPAQDQPSAPLAGEGGYVAAEVPAPAGTHLEQMATTSDRLLLRFAGPEGDRIVIVDPHSGRVTGTIAIAPGGK